MSNNNICCRLLVQCLPVSLVRRSDRNEFRPILASAVFYQEQYLPRFPRKLILCRFGDLFGLFLVVHIAVEGHHTRKLKRVVQTADIPFVRLVGDGRHIQPGDIGRHAVVLEHRLIIFVVDNRAQRTVRGFVELRIKRQGGRLRRCVFPPVVAEDNV